MKCERKRDLFNIFEVFTCDDCEYYCKDEFIFMGETRINIYYLASRCKLIEYDDEYIAFSKKLKMFIKDCILNQYNILCIWLKRDELELINDRYIYALYELIDDIHICIL